MNGTECILKAIKVANANIKNEIKKVEIIDWEHNVIGGEIVKAKVWVTTVRQGDNKEEVYEIHVFDYSYRPVLDRVSHIVKEKEEPKKMQYKFGNIVKTHDNKIGIITQIHQFTKEYFVMFPDGGRLYNEDEVIEWHGCW